ncbi:hypothetical protein DPMN_173170 [Dreissena polymorpha]|uniref:Uncharacterized protein n=1 Tax=Dreissena polymorpha TaxID=45954 RepID=A0A9D4E270_DREPO|nr:hypothetical protein DPMN_173170 [Dreissena polymorpha]
MRDNLDFAFCCSSDFRFHGNTVVPLESLIHQVHVFWTPPTKDNALYGTLSGLFHCSFSSMMGH